LVPEGEAATSVEALVLREIDQIAPPEPELAVSPDHGRHLVRMLTWLAVDPDYWTAPRTATASAGRVTVTATLTPTSMVWDLGNGDTVTCDSPGRVWKVGLHDSDATCGYTYTKPSINPPDHTYELSGSVSFEVSMTTNAPGSYGPFAPVVRTGSQTIQVMELQVVNVPND
jgi:hypothetical protein